MQNNRYRIIELVDGTHTIYLAEDTGNQNHRCWIREISAESINAAEKGISQRAYEQRSAMLDNLNHPLIAVVSDTFDASGNHYSVIAGAAGELLATRLAKAHHARLESAEALHITQAILEILSKLHSAPSPAAFGNLSPESVVIMPDKSIRLLDWYSDVHDDAKSIVVGYAAPEQYGITPVTGTSADVYSLGVLLTQMLCGYDPTLSKPYYPIPNPRDLMPSIPPNIEAVIKRALLIEPELRHANADEMRQGLTATVSLPAISPTVNAKKRTRRKSRVGPKKEPWERLPKQLWIGVGVVAAFILIYGGAVIGLRIAESLIPAIGTLREKAVQPVPVVVIENTATTQKPDTLPETAETTEPQQVSFQKTEVIVTEEPTVQEQEAVTTLEPTVEEQEAARTEEPVKAVISDGPLRLAYVSGSVGNTDIYVADQDGRNRVCVACRSCDESEPAWSPDGRSIIYQSNCDGSYDIWRVSSQGGTPVNLTKSSGIDEREPDWSSSDLIAFRMSPRDENRNTDGALWVMRSDGSGQRTLNNQGRSPVWSPDGKLITFMSERDGSWEIYTYNDASGRTTKLTNCTANCRWPAWSPDGRFVTFHSTTARGSVTADSIWTLSVETGKSSELVGGYSAGRPSWSAENLVAFNSDRGIEVVNVQGQNRRVILSSDVNWAPVWSR